MKIPLSLRAIYEARVDLYSRLKDRVDEVLNGIKESRWHYESRVKNMESYALKIESGRFAVPSELEDFFACTLVVENASTIHQAAKRVTARFPSGIERRPPNDEKTSKRAESFPFDDLRLYPKWSSGPSRPDEELEGVRFEVQIKTFLQHAWAVATHELVYKADRISWAERRIAFQIKAMLEHAEVSIAEAKPLAKSQSLKKTDARTQGLTNVRTLIGSIFAPEQLPSDIIRLSDNIWELLQATSISIDEIRKAVQKETSDGRGVKLANLSPYGILLQSLGNVYPDKIKKFLTSSTTRFRMVIPKEVSFADLAIDSAGDKVLRL